MAKAGTGRKLDLIRAAQASVRVPRASRLLERDPNERICACGCGEPFTATRRWQRFKDGKHRYRAWERENPRLRRGG
jgi:hypothetical protein